MEFIPSPCQISLPPLYFTDLFSKGCHISLNINSPFCQTLAFLTVLFNHPRYLFKPFFQVCDGVPGMGKLGGDLDHLPLQGIQPPSLLFKDSLKGLELFHPHSQAPFYLSLFPFIPLDLLQESFGLLPCPICIALQLLQLF